MLSLSSCSSSIKTEDLAKFERELLAPYLRDGKLVAVEHKMEVTPPVLFIEPAAWSGGTPSIARAQEYLRKGYRARDVASVSTVVFGGFMKGLHAFDVRTKSYRGTISGSLSDVSDSDNWIEEATRRDRGWRYGFTVAEVNTIVNRLGWDRPSAETCPSQIDAPILAVVKPGVGKNWEVMGGLGFFLTDGLGDIQATSLGDLKTVVLIEMSRESAGYYNFVGESEGIGMELHNDVAVIRAFDAETSKFLGSCIRKGKLGRTTTASSSGVALAAVLRGMVR
jgi:hypothetical protein